MKKLLLLFIILNVMACKEKSGESIAGLEFNDHRKTSQFSDFEKVSDTTFYNEVSGGEWSLLHLKNENNELVIFSEIANDPGNERNYKCLTPLYSQILMKKKN